ncbi:MAG: hypothetical protein JXA10_18475 [Anaerolineae bacterium]|nr:hypothetical protein [Anaerolineae bacterium]
MDILYSLIALALGYWFLRRRGGGAVNVIPTLRLQHYIFTPQVTDPKGTILEIEAIQPGFIARVMNWLGIGIVSTLRVTNSEIRVSLSRFSGTEHFVAPLVDLRAASAAVNKPAWALWVGVAIIAGDILGLLAGEINFGGMVFILIVGGLFLFHYYRTSRLLIAFSTSEVLQHQGIAFKARRVNGQDINQAVLIATMHYVNRTIVKAHLPDSLAPMTPQPAERI